MIEKICNKCLDGKERSEVFEVEHNESSDVYTIKHIRDSYSISEKRYLRNVSGCDICNWEKYMIAEVINNG